MKICLFSTTHFDGQFFDVMARGLTAVGAELLFVSLHESTAPNWVSELPGIKHVSLGAEGRQHYPLAMIKLATLLRREKVTILHIHLFDAGIVGLLAGQLAGVPLRFIARHHLDENWLLGTRWHIALDQWMARRADCVVVPSLAVRQHMLERETLSDAKIEIIPHGFDLSAMTATAEDAQRVRQEFGLANGFVLGCVGRFFKNKGHRYLFEAVRSLLPEHPDLRILLLGAGDRALIEELIVEFGLQQQVVFAGYRKDVVACMKAMDLLVHPSLSESFGQVLVEAMSVATPVIATTVGGVPEIVSHGETGWLVPPKDATALAAAIRQLRADPQRRAQLGLAGQRSVREKFTAEQMVSRHLEMYRRHLGKELKGDAYVGAEV